MSRGKIFRGLGLVGAILVGQLGLFCGKGQQEEGALPTGDQQVPGTMPGGGSSHQHEQPAHPAPLAKPDHETPMQEEAEKVTYHCPMHPEYTSDKPGNCPICGMTLVPVEKQPEEVGGEQEGTVYISPAKLQTIGVTFGEAQYRDLHKELRLTGRITYDETKMTEITSKFSGWTEELFVAFTGEMVKKGQPLLALYSPEVVAAQEEYLLALSAQDDATRALEAARQKLALWDLTEEQVRKLEQSRTPTRTITIYSPVTGCVVEKNVVAGTFIQPGQTLYRLADISTVWLVASVYEEDLPYLSLGAHVVAELPSSGGQVSGQVSYINPYLDGVSRTAQVRVVLANPGFRLRPETYATALVHIPLGQKLVVPTEAVLISGRRRVVFVDRGAGMIEPREIQVGAHTGDFIEVLSGVQAHERVVTSANFLIDSESRLKLALKKTHTH